MKTHIKAHCQEAAEQPPGAIIIRNLRTTSVGDHQEVSAEVDRDRIFFRAPPNFEIGCHVEPFIGIALLDAMIRNVDIKVEDSVTVSDKLLNALPEIQAIYACWNTDLRPIRVHARSQPCEEAFDHVASFYSGGVDGSHTLSRNLDYITHLIMLGGFEVAGNTAESWRLAVEKNTEFARSIGTRLVAIETNAKEWSDKRRIHWAFAQGLTLASMGPLLRAKRVFVAASHTYSELFPWGSHPLTDPMWSTESTTVVHDGAAHRRGEKMKQLCKHPQILENLKVCWHSIHENCGKCPKCIRTMIALYLLGASTQSLPAFKNKRGALRTFRVEDKSGASFLEDALILANEAGNRDIYRVLQRYYRIYQLRQVMKIIDKYIFGGIMRRSYRAFGMSKHSRQKSWRVEVRGAEDWDV